MSDTHQVDLLDDYEFRSWAATARQQLAIHGHAFVSLSPGDMTNYKIVVVQPLIPMIVGWQHPNEIRQVSEPVEGFTFMDQYWVGTSLGPLYQWHPRNSGYTSWDYVLDHWFGGTRQHEWTARVIARFLNTLREEMQ